MAAAAAIAFIVVFWALPIVLCSRMGRSRGKGSAWVWGFFLGWLGVLLVGLSAPRQPLILQAPPVGTIAPPRDPTKTCPACAEEVKQAAKVCRWCGHQFV